VTSKSSPCGAPGNQTTLMMQYVINRTVSPYHRHRKQVYLEESVNLMCVITVTIGIIDHDKRDSPCWGARTRGRSW
jgi:hypothetical protein